MAKTALIVSVPEAQATVGGLRDRFDASARLGVPAHITVLYPFMSPQVVDDTVLGELRAIFARQASFDYSLRKVGRFPIAAYLAPEPAEPFVAMTRAVITAYPAFPAYGGAYPDIVPHLTVATGDSREAEVAEHELGQLMLARGVIHATCSSVALLENSGGRWRQVQVFALASARN